MKKNDSNEMYNVKTNNRFEKLTNDNKIFSNDNHFNKNSTNLRKKRTNEQVKILKPERTSKKFENQRVKTVYQNKISRKMPEQKTFVREKINFQKQSNKNQESKKNILHSDLNSSKFHYDRPRYSPSLQLRKFAQSQNNDSYWHNQAKFNYNKKHDNFSKNYQTNILQENSLFNSKNVYYKMSALFSSFLMNWMRKNTSQIKKII